MSRLKFRRKEKKYTEVYNTIIFKNKNVELTGLYTTIQACIDLEINTQGTDSEFIVSKKTLQSFTGYKDDKFKRIWNELKQAGYLKQYKIKASNGKFEYEYELLDEPDLTTHHSLIINENGSITPNIPKSKIDKLIKDSDKIPGVENPPLEPGVENPHCGKMGGYYNNSLDKVCMYVCRAKEIMNLSNQNKDYIRSIKDKVEFELFEQVLVDASNKNKTFSYVEGTINNLLAENITTYDAHVKQKESYKKSFNKSRQSSKSSKKDNENYPKNKFHNFEQSIDNYSTDELDEIIAKSQVAKFENKNSEVNVDMEEANNNNDFSKMMYERCVQSNWNCVKTTKKYAIDYAIANGLDYPKDI